MSARLFAALELPAEVRAGLAAFGREAAARDRALRPDARGRPAPDAGLPRPPRARRDRSGTRGRARRGRLAGAGAEPRRPAVAGPAPARTSLTVGLEEADGVLARAAGRRRRAAGRRPAVGARGAAVPGAHHRRPGAPRMAPAGSTTCPRPRRRPSPPMRWCSSARTWAAADRPATSRSSGWSWRRSANLRAIVPQLRRDRA